MIKKERLFMQKVTKLVTFLLAFAILMSSSVQVFAGNINEREAELIEIGNGTFVYKGVEYVATDAAKQRVVNYLMRDDIDLNEEQAEEAKDLFWGNLAKGISDGYLVKLHPEESDKESDSSDDDWYDDSSDYEPEPETVVGYTYTDMAATMYAKQAVNVRNQPDVVGEKIGSLTMNQEVHVIGQCIETGWYCIIYGDTIAYVSDNYLVNNKIETETEEEDTTTEVATEVVTETESAVTEQVTEQVEVSTGAMAEAETEAETEEVVLREKEFNKGVNVMTFAMLVGVSTIAIAIGIVVAHRSNNRRYRK